MARLASPIANLKPHYCAVVVGSGYGGAIAAARMAAAGFEVCILERGRELQPGDYPDTTADVLREVQLSTPRGRLLSPSALYDLRFDDEIGVFVGCGLGGTSLINANVSILPDPRVLEDPQAWPPELDRQALARGLRRACRVLVPLPYPHPAVQKLAMLERSAAALREAGCYHDARVRRPALTVAFEDRDDRHLGVHQQACCACGDCVSGCNYGSKSTLLANYLPAARRDGAEIYTEVRVDRLGRRGARWVLQLELMGAGRQRFGEPTLTITADIVVLAAGTLGSTEILLRSGMDGLPLSRRLGAGFSGNGDVLAFAYNSDHPMNGVGAGYWPPDARHPIGPCITGTIELRDPQDAEAGILIEEGSLPGALVGALPAVFSTVALLANRGHDDDRPLRLRHERLRFLRRLGGPRAAIGHTQTFLAMAHDGAAGALVLEDGRLRIRWPAEARRELVERIGAVLRVAARPLGGIFIENPYGLITVHPLGGCRMAAHPGLGVVNHQGRVFDGPEAATVYDSLYVCDGSIVPRSLGVNPLLTICALAECITEGLTRRHRPWP